MKRRLLGLGWLVAAFVAVAVACAAPSTAAATTRPRASGSTCSNVPDAPLPSWARGGFHPGNQPMPHVLSTKGEIVAILWALHDPLVTPVPPSRNDKILWVSKVADRPGSNLQITAQRLTSSGVSGPVVERTVVGGPGPSSVEMPAAGCWQFTLRWSGHLDTVDLSYAAAAPGRTVG